MHIGETQKLDNMETTVRIELHQLATHVKRNWPPIQFYTEQVRY